MNFLGLLRSRLASALEGLSDDIPAHVEMLKVAQDAKFGDFQANCAMPLAKRLGRPPRDVATDIVSRLSIDDLCEPASIAGPGFINLRLKSDVLAQATTALVADPRLGVAPVEPPRTFVVDFSGPNVAKPMHVGHLRSTVIGRALDRVLRFMGHRVISDNHLGDWGTQFGMIIYGYKHFRDDAAYQTAPVTELARLYRLVNQLSDYHKSQRELPALTAAVTQAEAILARHQSVKPTPKDEKDHARQLRKLQGDLQQARENLESASKKIATVDANPQLSELAKTHPQIAELARRETAKLHAGDEENLRLWQQFIPQCREALDAMYQRMGVRFDLTLGESFYQPMLADVVARLQAQGLAVESDGAICVFIPGNTAPFIVRKADGAFSYATTDLATVEYRVRELKADVVLYVVDARQSEHFQMLFATCRQMGMEHLRLHHVSFGTILGDDRRPFKTRSGDTVGLESLLDEAVEHARAIVDANDDAKPNGPELDAAARASIAKIVGMGGIVYADLHHNRDSDYVFSWEKMLAKTGDTATYIQYAYARVRGIFAKDALDVDALRGAGDAIILEAPAERGLALQLNRFESALQDVLVDYRPNLLTQYLFDTANVFATFYEQCAVLKEPDPQRRSSRLLLCDLTARVLKQGLELLGIDVAEKM